MSTIFADWMNLPWEVGILEFDSDVRKRLFTDPSTVSGYGPGHAVLRRQDEMARLRR